MKPRLLDLFCCEGGAGTGYERAGFDVTGVDIEDRSDRYPFTFRQADASTDTDSPFRGEDSYEHLRCPQEVLSASRDGEQYGEHVEQGLAGRRGGDR